MGMHLSVVLSVSRSPNFGSGVIDMGHISARHLGQKVALGRLGPPYYLEDEGHFRRAFMAPFTSPLLLLLLLLCAGTPSRAQPPVITLRTSLRPNETMYANPTRAGGLAFFCTTNAANVTLHAVDGTTGTRVWSATTSADQSPGCGMVTADGAMVYLSAQQLRDPLSKDVIIALAAATGYELWRNSEWDGGALTYAPGVGLLTTTKSPTDNLLARLDERTGATLASAPYPSGSMVAFLPTVDGALAVVCEFRGPSCSAYNASAMRQLWSRDTRMSGYSLTAGVFWVYNYTAWQAFEPSSGAALSSYTRLQSTAIGDMRWFDLSSPITYYVYVDDAPRPNWDVVAGLVLFDASASVAWSWVAPPGGVRMGHPTMQFAAAPRVVALEACCGAQPAGAATLTVRDGRTGTVQALGIALPGLVGPLETLVVMEACANGWLAYYVRSTGLLWVVPVPALGATGSGSPWSVNLTGAPLSWYHDAAGNFMFASVFSATSGGGGGTMTEWRVCAAASSPTPSPSAGTSPSSSPTASLSTGASPSTTPAPPVVDPPQEPSVAATVAAVVGGLLLTAGAAGGVFVACARRARVERLRTATQAPCVEMMSPVGAAVQVQPWAGPPQSAGGSA